jgi:hypothetical protein
MTSSISSKGGTFLFTTTSILALEPTYRPIMWIAGTLSWYKADNSPPFEVEVKDV